MNILKYEVGKSPEEQEVKNMLEELQKMVGGYIEVTGLENNKYLLISNLESKFNGMAPNRPILCNDRVEDVIFGTFFICRSDGENFAGLLPEDIETIEKLGIIGGRIGE